MPKSATKKASTTTQHATAPQQRQLRMHPRLLWDVITKQAGTLQKAILEGIMNSIDAGSSYCKVNITEKRFTIEDDGRGFQSEDEIANFFETFGYPHEAGDATYGRFRMGRGQMFAFGANNWASNTFRMSVDLKPQEAAVTRDNGALSYDFSSGNDYVAGCRIAVDLYDKLLPSELDNAIVELKAWVKYAQIPIELNGKVISTRPQDRKWTSETDDAYVNIQEKSTLDVYNLGILVRKYPHYHFRCGGTVVSKTQLDVNFARNDIQSTCAVWKRISKLLRDENRSTASRKLKITETERETLARQLMAGELDTVDAWAAKVITTVSGSHLTLRSLLDVAHKQLPIYFGGMGDRAAEKAHQRGLIFSLANITLDRFDCETEEEFVDVLETIGRHLDPSRHYVNFTGLSFIGHEELKAIIPDDYEHVPAEKLNIYEQAALYALQRACDTTCMASSTVLGWQKNRKISVGEAESADAWTDGANHIWINRNQLPLLDEGMSGAQRLVSLMIHELLHNNNDMGSHVHDEEFYKKYHDIMIDGPNIGLVMENLVRDYGKTLRAKFDRRPRAAVIKSEDKVAGFSPELAAGTNLATMIGELSDARSDFGRSLNSINRSLMVSEVTGERTNLEAAKANLESIIDNLAKYGATLNALAESKSKKTATRANLAEEPKDSPVTAKPGPRKTRKKKD